MANSMLYSSLGPRLDTVGGFSADTINFWQTVKLANQDFQDSVHSAGAESAWHFLKWLNEHYGIQISLLDNGNFDPNYTIVNSEKYTIFLLKYSR